MHDPQMLWSRRRNDFVEGPVRQALKSKEDRVSKDFVALRTDGASPPDAIETISDAGFVFAVVPVSTIDSAKLADTFPVLSRHGDVGFEIATGAVLLRWTAPSGEIGALLERAGVTLVRNYGSGGVVMPKNPEDPFALAKRLLQLDFIVSASPHTISKAVNR